MTLGDTAATMAATDPRAQAFGYAQRRSWVFVAWWYGATLAIPGAVDAGLSGLLGQDPERGIFMMIFGAVGSALGWLLTLGVRFSRKLPKPASDIPRVEQSIRINPSVIRFSVIGAVLIAAGLVLFTPNGRSPQVLPIVGLIAAAQLSIAAGVAYSGWLLKNSAELYSRWLERR
ncbi:hypothetical protein [Arthrobacter sp. ZGTC412]|uniref:hypothetical protein n=1 Tax=Arthrobacter sp. ZGTC412 TaxID=2058900 RepID=UPI0011B06069|nr:hypothetical protein [Arthrobacter sp. ZGTC412]